MHVNSHNNELGSPQYTLRRERTKGLLLKVGRGRVERFMDNLFKKQENKKEVATRKDRPST